MKTLLNLSDVQLRQVVERDRGTNATVHRYLEHRNSDNPSSDTTVPMTIRTVNYEKGSQGRR
jgi:hypothetical protein